VCRKPDEELLFRPPGTLVSEGLMFLPVMFFFFRWATSELPRAIAVKLCHMIAIWVNFIMQVQKFGGPSPQRNWGPKTCEIRSDFRQLQTSIANLRNGSRYPNSENALFQVDSSRVPREKSGELWSTNYRELDVSLDPPKLHFSGDYISAPRACWPLKF